jgi:hypothetical protein
LLKKYNKNKKESIKFYKKNKTGKETTAADLKDTPLNKLNKSNQSLSSKASKTKSKNAQTPFC